MADPPRARQGASSPAVPGPIHVTLFGYLGGRNLGDDAMLAGLLTTIPTGSTVEVLARDPAAVAPWEGPPLDLKVLDAGLRAALASIWRSDVVVRVGGTSFHDEYAPSERQRMRRNYVKLSALFLLPRLLRTPVAAIGIGAGRTSRTSTRWLARLAMRCCQVVIARDAASAAELEPLARPGRVQVGTDLAWLRPDPAERAAAERAPDVLGISVIDLAPHLGAARPARDVWRNLLAAAVATTGCREVALFGFRDNEVETDTSVVQEVAGLAEDQGLLVTRWSYDDGVREVTRQVAGCRWFLAARYHAAVFASCAGVDLAVVPYNAKLLHFAAEAGLGPGAVADPQRWSAASGAPGTLAFEQAVRPGVAVVTMRAAIDELWQGVACHR